MKLARSTCTIKWTSMKYEVFGIDTSAKHYLRVFIQSNKNLKNDVILLSNCIGFARNGSANITGVHNYVWIV